jgi:hypothetical protein
MDIYTDFFSRAELMRVLALMPYTPGQLGSLGVFQSVPLSGTVFGVEEQPKNGGRVLTAMPRGAPRQTMGQDKRKVHTFAVTDQYGDQGAVWADEALNARGAGTTGAKEVVEQRRGEQMARMRLTVDLTHEVLRMTKLLSPASTEFGAAAAGVAIAVQTDATKTRKEIFDKIRVPINAALDGTTYTGIIALCSDGYWSEMMGNKEFRETYVNWEAATALRAGIGAGGQSVTPPMPYGDVLWQWYRGTSACKIPDNEARAIPLGVPDMAWQCFAPNTTVESVGSGALGQPYYVGSKPITDSQGTLGWEMSIQSHVRMVWGRPGAVIPIAKS